MRPLLGLTLGKCPGHPPPKPGAARARTHRKKGNTTMLFIKHSLAVLGLLALLTTGCDDIEAPTPPGNNVGDSSGNNGPANPCIPDCKRPDGSALECGANGCGGTCGVCPGNFVCDQKKSCQPPE